MIVFKNVSKYFGSQKAVNNLSFTIAGGVVGLLGVNGAGKTTTLRLAVNYLTPNSGKIYIQKLSWKHHHNLLKKRIGYLPENNPLWTEMRVIDYLNFLGKIKNSCPSNITQVIKDCTINEVLKERIENLSLGYKQRVGLAGALLNYPPLLILDEPTSSLDPKEQQAIVALIKKIAKNRALLISSHSFSLAEEICSRVLILDKGTLVYDGYLHPCNKNQLKNIFFQVISKNKNVEN